MLRSIRARLTAGLAIALLTLSLAVSPVAAAGGTNRWVDDDAGGSGGPSACATAGYTSIQDAIDDSSAGDWVYVCPGTYTESLTIPTGVKVKARPLFRAKIVAPSDGSGAVVNIPGNNARLRGFFMHIPAGSGDVNVGPTATCVHYDAAIMVTGDEVVVRDNRISSVDGATLSGPCGYDYGIVIGAHGDSATARVTFNWVTDFKRGGILVEDTDSYAWVRRNTIRFFHLDDCPIPAFSACAPTVAPSVNDSFPLTFGIGIESEARADVSRNWVGSGPDACTTLPSYACPPTSTPALTFGVALTGLDGSETTTVHANVVTRAFGGVATQDAADGAVISGNHVSAALYGFQVGGDNDEFHDNFASGSVYGTSVSGGGNNFHDNDFRNNLGVDCADYSSGTGTGGTANTWTNNLGNVETPAGICIADAP